MVVHFFCTNASDLSQLAPLVGPHFTCEPDSAGAFVGAVECKNSSDLEYVRGLPSVAVFPLPRLHDAPLSQEQVALIADRYGVKSGDSMTAALTKIHAAHPIHWFNGANF